MAFRNKIVLISGIFFMLQLCFVSAQNTENSMKRIPSVKIKDAKGKSIDASSLSNNGKPFIICFWKTCCKPPLQELDAIAEVYSDWHEETGVVLYAVSVDDSRSSNTAVPYAMGQGYEYEILLDVNSDLKRAMNVNIIPTTFICDGDGNIVWQKTMYAPGDEDLIFNILEKTASVSRQ
jgi:peroxiredoxin